MAVWSGDLPSPVMAIFSTEDHNFYSFISLPGQSPGRAIALASASVSTFTLKFFKSLYFPDHLIDLVYIWYDDRYSPNFYSAIPQPITAKSRSGQGHRLRNF